MRFIGQRVRRVEDPGLLTGVAEFTGDIGADALEICFVRSVHADARITRIDLEGARDAEGVVGVFAGGDFDSVAGYSAVPVPPEVVRPHLAIDRVRFVGEIVAVVVARSLAEAQDRPSSWSSTTSCYPAWSKSTTPWPRMRPCSSTCWARIE